VAGQWKIAQYNLALPIPNDLIEDVVRAMRGEDALEIDPKPTLVVVVRHAEKRMESGNPDPPLTPEGNSRAEALAVMTRDLPLRAVYATQYARTRQTVEPTAHDRNLEITRVDAQAVEKLARILETKHPDACVLVSGHSGTIPELLRELGVREEVNIRPGEYDDLFLVLLNAGNTPYFMHLHYGKPTPQEK
jgi:broad specificity phosphatase PhoE